MTSWDRQQAASRQAEMLSRSTLSRRPATGQAKVPQQLSAVDATAKTTRARCVESPEGSYDHPIGPLCKGYLDS